MNKVLYKYVRSDGTPYYIGIGDPNRPFSPHKHGGANLLPKDSTRIIILETNLSADRAKQLEKYWIAFYGRKDIGTGILRNRTDGGEGTEGFTRTKESTTKGVTTKRERGNHIPSPEVIAKRVATRKANGTYGLSPESSAKRLATIKERGKDKQSKETITKRVESTRASGGYDRPPEAYAKAAQTRKEKGNNVNPSESFSKGWATRKAKAQTLSHSTIQASTAASLED